MITQECAFDQSVTGLETLQQDLVDILDDIIPVCRHENIYQMCIRDRYRVLSGLYYGDLDPTDSVYDKDSLRCV